VPGFVTLPAMNFPALSWGVRSGSFEPSSHVMIYFVLVDKYDIRVEAFMVQPDASRLYQLAEDVARHEFSIPIARTMKLQDIQEAHRIWERGRLGGKIVLVP